MPTFFKQAQNELIAKSGINPLISFSDECFIYMILVNKWSNSEHLVYFPCLLKTLTCFLCVSPADGVALGAAASTSQTSVQLIVFVAIMLHKVTLAFFVSQRGHVHLLQQKRAKDSLMLTKKSTLRNFIVM